MTFGWLAQGIVALGLALLPVSAVAQQALPPTSLDQLPLGLQPVAPFFGGDLPGLQPRPAPVPARPIKRRLSAMQIDANNIDSLPRGGPDSIAGLGDWWLSNGKLCVAISDVDHDTGIVRGGGNLIDYGSCASPNDQWTYSNVLTGLAKEAAIPVQAIHVEAGDEAVALIASGEGQGLRQTVTYRLGLDAEVLEMEIAIERLEPGKPLRISGFFTLYSQRALTPFTLSSYRPEASLGFQQRFIDRHHQQSVLDGMLPADWNILVGSNLRESQASYGVRLVSAELVERSGSRHQLPSFLAAFPNYSMHGWLTRPLWWQSQKLDWLSMLQTRFMDLKIGERMLARFQLHLGMSADVASITDQVYRGPKLRGYSNLSDVSFSVWDPRGRPVTQVRPESDGSFDIRLPSNMPRVRVEARAPWGQRISRDINVADTRNDTGRWFFRHSGVLTLPTGLAMSLYFSGLNGTPDPVFGDDLLDFRLGGESPQGQLRSHRIDLAGLDSDPRYVSLPPGQYRVLASRGLEYKVDEYLLTVVGGMVSQLPLVAPQRHWYHADWRSADLHVHSGASFDSTLPMQERLRTFVAQGAEILVATEHNRYTDQSAVVAEMGLEEQLQLVAGSELTGLSRGPNAPYTIGHSNVFPVVPDNREFAGGMVPIENRRLAEVIAAAKERDPGSLFQLNHPRGYGGVDSDRAFFEHLSIGRSYDPDKPLTSPANESLLEIDPDSGARDLDFDLLEVISGSDFDRYQQVRADWFSLLNQGVVKVATGNSDSHGLRQLVAMPRNYVYLPGASRLPVDEKQFVAALKQGRSYLTTGPLLQLTLRDEQGRKLGMGDTLLGNKGVLDIQVDVAPWVAVQQMTIWVNGRVYRQLPLNGGDHKVVDVVVGGDAWLVVEVTGPATEVYRSIAPGLAPLALSNPIYFDADADGEWLPVLP